MGHVGLVFVGLILMVNGLVAIGRVPPRSAAILNLMVGSLQILLPTVTLIQAAGDQPAINGAWPGYLFGMTYLWVGYSTLSGADLTAFGWFSGFVAAIALYQAILAAGPDPLFAVIWLAWALMWTGFFLPLALGKTRIGRLNVPRATGWLLLLGGIPSSTVPALFAQQGVWSTQPAAGAAVLVLLAGVVLAAGLLGCRAARQQPLLAV